MKNWEIECVVCGCLANEGLILVDGRFCLECTKLLVLEVFGKFKKLEKVS